MKIAIASDHGGYSLKEEIKNYLKSQNYKFKDFGCDSVESCDYADFGFLTAEAVACGKFNKGILICKSGIGMSITANKVKGIRAALCNNTELAEKSRKHNDANILVLGAEDTDPLNARLIVNTWLKTEFEGGRHKRRIDKITEYENNK